MRSPYLALAASLSGALIAQLAMAEGPPLSQKYLEPTRGFFIEHGNVTNVGQASVELHSGSDSLNSGGGIRLGLPGAELIFNSQLSNYDENEMLLKWEMPSFQTSENAPSSINWALISAVSHTDIEPDSSAGLADQTSFKAGFAATVNADAGTFTLAPQFVYTNGDIKDDTFVEVGAGAYVRLIDTRAGLFSLGAEGIFTTEDNQDNSYYFGARWTYNEKLNIDIIPLVYSDNDLLGIPGMIRLNVAFY